jgi:hypothetical protein
MIWPSIELAAPAPTCTWHLVMDEAMELLVMVAVYPVTVGLTAAVLPVEKV